MIRGAATAPVFTYRGAADYAEVNEMDCVYLYDIDSLQSIAEQSLALRRQQVAAGEKIIAEHVSDFCARFGSDTDKPTPPAAPRVLDDAAMRASEL